MADQVVTQGLQRIADTASQTSGYSASRFIRTFSVDDSATALTAGTTNAGSPSNFFDQAFDATPTRSSLTVSHVTSLAAADAAFTHRRLMLHDDTVANVTGASNTIVAGIDGLSITKPSNVPFSYTFDLVYEDTTP